MLQPPLNVTRETAQWAFAHVLFTSLQFPLPIYTITRATTGCQSCITTLLCTRLRWMAGFRTPLSVIHHSITRSESTRGISCPEVGNTVGIGFSRPTIGHCMASTAWEKGFVSLPKYIAVCDPASERRVQTAPHATLSGVVSVVSDKSCRGLADVRDAQPAVDNSGEGQFPVVGRISK